MKLPEISVKRPIMTLMVFLAVLIIGSISFLNLQLDLLPRIEPPVMTVITPWPGASASDVEQRITKVMENSLSMLEGVDDNNLQVNRQCFSGFGQVQMGRGPERPCR